MTCAPRRHGPPRVLEEHLDPLLTDGADLRGLQIPPELTAVATCVWHDAMGLHRVPVRVLHLAHKRRARPLDLADPIDAPMSTAAGTGRLHLVVPRLARRQHDLSQLLGELGSSPLAVLRTDP